MQVRRSDESTFFPSVRFEGNHFGTVFVRDEHLSARPETKSLRIQSVRRTGRTLDCRRCAGIGATVRIREQHGFDKFCRDSLSDFRLNVNFKKLDSAGITDGTVIRPAI